MRRTTLLCLFALLAVSVANEACAQRRGGAGPGFARHGNGFSRARARSPYGLGYPYLPYDSGDAYMDAPPPVLDRPTFSRLRRPSSSRCRGML
jgi:uncharacterized membrane protein